MSTYDRLCRTYDNELVRILIVTDVFHLKLKLAGQLDDKVSGKYPELLSLGFKAGKSLGFVAPNHPSEVH